MIVDVDAFKDAGWTQNMRQTYQAASVPAIDVLQEILTPYHETTGNIRMVISIDEEAEVVRVTTRKFAEREGRAVFPLGGR